MMKFDVVNDVPSVLYPVYDFYFLFFKQKTAYEMRISDWSSDVCSSDLQIEKTRAALQGVAQRARVQCQMTECGKAADLEPVRVEAEKLIVECAGDVEPQRAERVGRYERFVEREPLRRDGGPARKVGGSGAPPDAARQPPRTTSGG